MFYIKLNKRIRWFSWL